MGENYYNEVDPFAAQLLRVLIQQGHIAPGVVDERPIEDVVPADLTGFTQCHFFAGIGVWSYALRRAGWPDDKPVWTGSCPCQPFSAAGKAGGFADERHLWPHWYHLIQHGKPKDVPIFGEQVASKDGLAWLDLVQTDLERAGYASGAVDLCAAGVGAPHIRQRLFFVAERMADCERVGHEMLQRESGARVDTGRNEKWALSGSESSGIIGGMAQSNQQQRNRSRDPGAAGRTELAGLCRDSRPGPTNGLWRDADWLYCRDGKWRPIEPGTFPLVNGAAAGVGRLRGYGNAINAEVAAAFIEAYQEVRRCKN